MVGDNKVTRRNFLKTTGLTAAGMAALSAKSYAQISGANDRLNLGIIGCGGMAGHHLGKLLEIGKEQNMSIGAVCDVYDKRARGFQERIKGKGGQALIFHDYHDLLAVKDIDYILNATPEHQHSPITLAALEAGKHVYCEKPLTHIIEESQAVAAKVKQTHLKLQVGVQGMSDDSYSSAHEAIRAGKIGRVIEAQIDYVRHYPPDCGPFRKRNKDGKRYTDSDPKPADLDWEAWLGSATKRPWSAPRYYEWRCYRDYSGGIATDLFVHRLTRILKACGLSYPSRAVGMGDIYLWPDGRDLPDNFEMMLEYPKTGDITPGMTVSILGTMGNDHQREHCIRGTEGTLIFTTSQTDPDIGDGWKIVAIKSRKGNEKVLATHKRTGSEDVSLHHKNLHAAIRQGAELYCPVEMGMYGVVAVCMANQSWFERKMLSWDAEKGAVVAS